MNDQVAAPDGCAPILRERNKIHVPGTGHDDDTELVVVVRTDNVMRPMEVEYAGEVTLEAMVRDELEWAAEDYAHQRVRCEMAHEDTTLAKSIENMRATLERAIASAERAASTDVMTDD